jgi:hypothetical protein
LTQNLNQHRQYLHQIFVVLIHVSSIQSLKSERKALL